jgi:hypothetical protein
LTVSAEDIAAYHRDGAVLLKRALSADDIRLLERGVEEVYANPGRRSSIVRGPDGDGETLVETSPSDHSPSLRALRDNGVAAEIAGRIMQTSSAQLVFEQIFYKTKGRNLPTPWHQDTPFLRVRGYDMCRVWLTCDPSPGDITVQVVRGSHRWNVVYSTQPEAPTAVRAEQRAEYDFDDLGDPNLPLAPDIARYRDSFDILCFDVEPGDALVFQGNMLHGSAGREHWDRPRRAFATMWGGPNLRYHTPQGKAFPVPGRHDGPPIPNGAPIGGYEAAFPVGWRAAS